MRRLVHFFIALRKGDALDAERATCVSTRWLDSSFLSFGLDYANGCILHGKLGARHACYPRLRSSLNRAG
jgi:hypothetical protein